MQIWSNWQTKSDPQFLLGPVKSQYSTLQKQLQTQRATCSSFLVWEKGNYSTLRKQVQTHRATGKGTLALALALAL